ncbi:DUF3977 family protein [Chloroflexia bacterium SDU3-3]|nr:DUF3977 family protein [Chloroflexia bacterium SDU3-3]
MGADALPMNHFVECGLGNPWPLSTEHEYADGVERRIAGAAWPHAFSHLYLRCWVGYAVLVLNRHGLHAQAKRRWAFKLLLGVAGHTDDAALDARWSTP